MEEEGRKVEVLDALDSAKTQKFHFTALIVAGIGFLAGAYDLFSISLVTRLLGRIYYHHEGSPMPGTLPPNVSSAISAVILCGALVGQLFFGWLGDRIGRKEAYGIALVFMIISPVGSGLSFSDRPASVMATLCFFRFWVGFGVGGSQPLCATIVAEYANKRTRGRFLAAVYLMSGIGSMSAGMVGLILSSSFKAGFPAPPYAVDPIRSTVPQADFAWRVMLMFGAVPATAAFFQRRKLPETARYTALIANNAKQAAADMSKVLNVDLETTESQLDERRNQFGLFSKEFLRRHGRHLLGTTSTWFFMGIAFYSQTLFQKDIFISMKWIPIPSSVNALEEVFKVTRAQILVSLLALPGFWFTMGFIEKLGRFTIQLMGFFFMTAFMFALAIPYDHWTQKDNRIGFLVIYALTFFFANFGPNATTFVVAAEIFPARFRSTCHGISAASGKAGSIVGAFGFLYAAQSPDPMKHAGYPAGIGVRKSLILLGCANFLGMVFTLLIPEPKGKSLEEMSKEYMVDEEEKDKKEEKITEMAHRTVPV